MCDGFEFLTVWWHEGRPEWSTAAIDSCGPHEKKTFRLFVSEPKIKWKGVREKRERTTDNLSRKRCSIPRVQFEFGSRLRTFGRILWRFYRFESHKASDLIPSVKAEKEKWKVLFLVRRKTKNWIFRWKFGAQSSVEETKTQIQCSQNWRETEKLTTARISCKCQLTPRKFE